MDGLMGRLTVGRRGVINFNNILHGIPGSDSSSWLLPGECGDD